MGQEEAQVHDAMVSLKYQHVDKEREAQGYNTGELL